MTYNIEDFTEENYSRLLKIAADYYEFTFFTEEHSGRPIVIWRHDVDFSVSRAVKLAEIEQNIGVKSTFFFQIGSEFYNVFEGKTRRQLLSIIEMGHDIALHFDPTAYEISNLIELEEKLKYEKGVLEGIVCRPVSAFSYHNPTETILKFDQVSIADMVNTYSAVYRDSYGYCSDSNGYWRHERLEDVLLNREHKKLQVLTHPGWWQESAMPPRQRIERCIDGRSEYVKNFYDSLLQQFNRKNIK